MNKYHTAKHNVSFISVFAVLLALIFIVGLVIWSSKSSNHGYHPDHAIEIRNEPAYKEGFHGGGEIFYKVYDKFGYVYYVNEEQYDSLAIPEKLGDSGLYLLPDGSYSVDSK